MSPRPLFITPHRSVVLFWAALAMLNLSAGIFIAATPERTTDLDTMMRWGRSWLIARENVYQAAESGADYPPNAIVQMSLLGLLPFDIAVPLWITVNLSLACVAPYLAARFVRPHDPFRVILLPILMFLCWGGMRTLAQFSLLALTCSMAALVVAERRPGVGGVWLGLAMMKPQVAFPVLMWAVFTRRWRVVMTAAAFVVTLFAIFCAWADASPIAVLSRYTAILARYHTGDAILMGLSELRPLIRLVIRDVSDLDTAAVSVSVALLTGISIAGAREGAARRRLLYAAPAFVACWSLMTFYHLTYGFIILLPAMMLLALNHTPVTPLRKGVFWLVQLGMMFDVPGLARRSGLGGTAIYGDVLSHADRVLIAAIFVGLVVLAWTEPPD